MLAGISLLWTAGLFQRGGPRPRRLWIGLAGVAGAFVLIAPLFEQWLQGVATQFSVGFTLLPAPVSALALAAWIYAAFALNSGDAAARTRIPWAWEAGAGVLLLPAAGYQLQLNYQHILLIITLLLMTGLLRPLSGPGARSAGPPTGDRAAGHPGGTARLTHLYLIRHGEAWAPSTGVSPIRSAMRASRRWASARPSACATACGPRAKSRRTC